jgi:hypothetical protein
MASDIVRLSATWNVGDCDVGFSLGEMGAALTFLCMLAMIIFVISRPSQVYLDMPFPRVLRGVYAHHAALY